MDREAIFFEISKRIETFGYSVSETQPNKDCLRIVFPKRNDIYHKIELCLRDDLFYIGFGLYFTRKPFFLPKEKNILKKVSFNVAEINIFSNCIYVFVFKSDDSQIIKEVSENIDLLTDAVLMTIKVAEEIYSNLKKLKLIDDHSAPYSV